MLIDTHCHLTYPELRERIDDVLRAADQASVTRMITVATDPADARAALELMRDHPRISLAAGIHPHEAGKVTEADLQLLADLHRGHWDGVPAERLVAVGEAGLDFHYDFATPADQERVFRFQLELANEVGRPVVIHAREAEAQVCAILRDYPGLRDRVVFHCFSGSVEVAEEILADGHWLSFTGVLTFRNADEIRRVAALVPAERLMVETDAPYLAPEPHRKQRPNRPDLVVHTARRLAEVRGLTAQALADLTTRNAERFFGLTRA